MIKHWGKKNPHPFNDYAKHRLRDVLTVQVRPPAPVYHICLDCGRRKFLEINLCPKCDKDKLPK